MSAPGRTGRAGISALSVALFLALTVAPLASAQAKSQGESQAQSQSQGRSQAGVAAADRLIVKFKTGQVNERLSVLEFGQERQVYRGTDHGLSAQGKKLADRLYVVTTRGDINERLAALRADPRVEYAEPDYQVSVNRLPNDPDVSLLWGLHNTGQTGGTADADIDAPQAWDFATGSTSIVVGVIDTGIDYTHPDLAANMWTNPGEVAGNGLDDDGNGYVDDVHGYDFLNNDGDPFDDHGHGTHVAGTIGAVGDNGIGVAGVNWTTKIAGLKFLSAWGSGWTSDAIEAVLYANAMGIRITNNSWSGGSFSQGLYDAIAAGNEAGNLFVAAAGNAGSDTDAFPRYPSAYDVPSIIAVAATNHADGLAGFSNYGATTVDLGAPGVDVYSTVPTGGCSLCSGTGYRYLSGTSMASPHVAGAAALLWGTDASQTGSAVKAALLNLVDPVGSLAGKSVSGGRLNLYNYFDDDSVVPSAVATLSVVGSTHNTLIVRWTAVGDDGLIGQASRYDLRYATTPLDKVTFEAATAVVVPGPQPSGATEEATIRGLDHSTTYYMAVKVRDNMGNWSVLSNVATGTTQPAVVIFSDDMESGQNGWTVTGSNDQGGPALWHQSTRRSQSPLIAWYYGQESTGNFDTGTRNFGSLTSPPIDLAVVSGAELRFSYFLAKESLMFYDRAQLHVSDDGGLTWAALEPYVSTDGVWVTRSVDLSAYDGRLIQVRFWFDTIDHIFNAYEGWYVDDVTIIGTLTGNVVPVAVAGGPYAGPEDAVLVFDGSGSFDLNGDPLTYHWDFGDGTTAVTGGSGGGSGGGGNGGAPSLPTVTHLYTLPGQYAVKLVVNDGMLDSNPSLTIATVAAVNDAPVANAGPDKSGLTGQTLSFSGHSSSDEEGAIIGYHWDFGDGMSSDGSTVSHVYTSAGTYKVTLTVTDAGGLTGHDTATATISAADLVAVTSAIYTSSKLELSVIATSTGAPTATLTLVGYGPMAYDARRTRYTLEIRSTPKPLTVTVTSSLGGRATAPVVTKGGKK